MTPNRIMKRLILLSFTMFAIQLGSGLLPSYAPFAVATASAQSVSRIVVQGNKRIDAETIRAYVVRSASAAARDESTQALFATGLFRDVAIRRSGNTLIVTVEEYPVISRVIFRGNKKLPDATLAGTVSSQARGVFSQAQVDNDVARIEETYRRSGREKATVSARAEPLDDGRVDLIFTIVEGDKTRVADIVFEGNENFSDYRLKRVITTRESGLLSFLRTTDIYDPDRLDADQELLRRFYHKNGYIDFQVLSVQGDFNAERNNYTITFMVDEGKRYSIGEVAIETVLSEIDADSLARLVRTQTGDVYNGSDVQRTVEDLTIAVAERGFAHVDVRSRAERDFDAMTVDLTYVIDEGQRIYIERINIRGNDRSADYVIRREFDMAEGDAYNRALADKAERRLRNLDFFNNVSISTEPGSTPDKVIVNVDVSEKATGSLSAGVGYSDKSFVADVTFKERNFMGRGQYVALTGKFGKDQRSYEFSFVEPFFMDRRMSLGLSGHHSSQGSTDYRNYKMDSTGGSIRLGLPIKEDELTLFLKYSLEQRNIKLSDAAQKEIDDSIAASIKDPNKKARSCADYLNRALCSARNKSTASIVGVSLVYDTLDNKQEPSKGYYVNLSGDVAGLGGDVKFIRATLHASAFYPFSEDLNFVGMVRFRAGAMRGWSGDSDMRLIDNFFQGGETIRGFASLGYGPRDRTSRGNALGGTMYYNATTEVRFPIPLLPEELGFSSAVFAEAGTLFDPGNVAPLTKAEYYNDSKIRASVGGSLIWRSPFGPIRADFSHVVKKQPYDKTQWFRVGAYTRF